MKNFLIMLSHLSFDELYSIIIPFVVNEAALLPLEQIERVEGD